MEESQSHLAESEVFAQVVDQSNRFNGFQTEAVKTAHSLTQHWLAASLKRGVNESGLFFKSNYY